MIDELIQAVAVNHATTIRVLDGIDDEGLLCTLSTRGGRNVARQFAHIQNVRRYQLEKRARPVADGVIAFEGQAVPDRGALARALDDSAERIEAWFRGVDAELKGFRTLKGGLPRTLAYLVAHESHHRGNILLTLKQCGHPVAKDLRDRIWDWNRA